jgi:four helix bundle protein
MTVNERPHKKLEVWKKGIKLVKDIYSLTCNFPNEEKFGLISQLRRAAVSVPTNIAEGAARNTKKEFINFLYISSGSLSEIDTLLVISTELNFLSIKDLEEINKKILKIDIMLKGLISTLKKQLKIKLLLCFLTFSLSHFLTFSLF